MRFLKRLLIVLVVLVLIFAAATVYFLANAKRIVLTRMEASIGVPVEISAFRISWPLSVEIEGLSVGKNIKVQRLQVVPGLTGMLSGGLVFDKIVVDKPTVKLVRLPDNTVDIGLPQRKEQSKVSFVMRKLDIENGRVEFVDSTLSQPLTLFAENLVVHAKQASLVQITRIDFDASASIVDVKGEKAGGIATNGWIDWLPKNMNAVVTVTDVHLVPFAPYYRDRIKKDLQSGLAQAKADLISEKNDLSVNCHVELNDVAFKMEEQPAQEQPDFNNMTSAMLNSMFTAEGGAIFDFSIRTKLDQPKFENLKIKGSFLQAPIQQMISNPEQTMEQYQQVGQQFEEIGKQFKKMFKKD